MIQNCIAAILNGSLETGRQVGNQSVAQQAAGAKGSGADGEVNEHLEALWTVPGNRNCADCAADNPEWISLNLGILMCLDCSGVHRAMGVHISKVRSTVLDKLDRHHLEYLQAIGNVNANTIWEGDTQGAGVRPTAASSRHDKEAWIRAKYELKSFLARPKQQTVQDVTNQAFAAIEEDDPLALLQAIVWGADIQWSDKSNDGRSLTHQAVMYGNPVCTELLVQAASGNELTKKEARGWTPLHYAAYQDDVTLVDLILARGGSTLALMTDEEGNTPLQTSRNYAESGHEPACASSLLVAEKKSREKQS